MRNKTFWTLTLSLSFLSLAVLTAKKGIENLRTPASQQEDMRFVLEVKSVDLTSSKQLRNVVGSELRATFNRSHDISLKKFDDAFLNSKKSGNLNIKMNIDPKWIQDDKLEFKIELVKTGLIDQIMVRCAQVSKRLSEYNRSYQCFLPGEDVAFITYRLSKERLSRTSIASK